ncbi:MAG: PHP domain-containing protein [Lachnospiraceae bacterium]|nr:PHP domain-containing protein [Lachnospiraceae bacterium]
MYLISPKKKQYKANLHCHSTNSDGRLTPEQLKEVYRRHGYDILAITDHEYPCDHSELGEDDFLMITGYEGYIRSQPNNGSDRFGPEVHLNLLARHPDNETLICYNKPYGRFIPDDRLAQLRRAGSEETRAYTTEYINKYIQTARENGYLVTYNHPWWSMETEERIRSYEGYFSMEMCNYGCHVISGLEYSGVIYDKMLCAGKRIFCHAADDNHNKFPEGHPEWDSCGAFTMVLADELEYGAVINALETGEMYSSMGPVFHEVSFDGKQVHVECSEVKAIYVFCGSKSPRRVFAPVGQTIIGADIVIDEPSRYIRVTVEDHEGKKADTRGYFRDELGLPPLK